MQSLTQIIVIQQSVTSFHTRVSAITPSTKDFLKSINVWNELERKKAFVATQVWDQNSHGHLNFHASDEGLKNLGYIIENDVIQSALFRAIETSNATMIQASLVELNANKIGYKVDLDNGQTLSCKLLIGADGPQSKVRSLANIDFKEHNYQSKGYHCKCFNRKASQTNDLAEVFIGQYSCLFAAIR